MFRKTLEVSTDPTVAYCVLSTYLIRYGSRRGTDHELGDCVVSLKYKPLKGNPTHSLVVDIISLRSEESACSLAGRLLELV